jgi:hypothetical protein
VQVKNVCDDELCPSTEHKPMKLIIVMGGRQYEETHRTSMKCSTEVCLQANSEKTKSMFMACHQKKRQNQKTQITNKRLKKNVANINSRN